MKYIVLPINDMKQLYSDKELETMRKSIDGTQVIVHEELLLEKRKQLGLAELPVDGNGAIQWTYPNYEYESRELNDLLESEAWQSKGDKNDTEYN